jgi:hypothetical protein
VAGEEMVARAVRPVAIDPTDLRIAGVVTVAAGALLPLLPLHGGVACPLRTLTGVPCPLCGMTTSVEATVRLDPHAAVAANPGGVAAVLAAIALVVLRPRRLRIPPAAPVVVLTLLWVWELVRFSIL